MAEGLLLCVPLFALQFAHGQPELRTMHQNKAEIHTWMVQQAQVRGAACTGLWRAMFCFMQRAGGSVGCLLRLLAQYAVCVLGQCVCTRAECVCSRRMCVLARCAECVRLRIVQGARASRREPAHDAGSMGEGGAWCSLMAGHEAANIQRPVCARSLVHASLLIMAWLHLCWHVAST